ncbi:MAG TPA: hypothetical protein VED01_14120 [Burkholderiales bacterium]|nr:hypothetical protein [Burkholderiales bacterium]
MKKLFAAVFAALLSLTFASAYAGEMKKGDEMSKKDEAKKKKGEGKKKEK